MDFSLQKSILSKNLKYWGIHSLINAIPSFAIAYTHDWNTAKCVIAMLLGIIIYIGFLTYFTSLTDINHFLSKPFMKRALKVGTWFRAIICLIPIPFFLFYYLFPELAHKSALAPSFTWGFDFISGLLSHEIYRNFANIIPIRGVHNFLPTTLITIMQGFFITLSLLVSGIMFSGLCSLPKLGDKVITPPIRP